jgi:NOL1/NOP2/sun family putative RNA methylase
MAGYIRRAPVLVEEFSSRMKKLLDGDEDFKKYLASINIEPLNYIRCNTLKVSANELLGKLRLKGWTVTHPFSDYPSIMLIQSKLLPGEIGKSREHLLGYYYVQEVVSMMPLLALNPSSGDILLDLASAPGSKTTQAASMMDNKGLIVANDSSPGRTRVLAANLERMGVSNTIISCEEGTRFCEKTLSRSTLRFSKVLLDAPCSGEGTIRSSPSATSDWSMRLVESISRTQKKLILSAFSVLASGGEMVYSTCTHAPEENELIVNFLLNNRDAKIVPFKLPLKSRPGITKWESESFHPDLKFAHRIYPHDNDSEGFFLCKIKKLSDKINGVKQ